MQKVKWEDKKLIDELKEKGHLLIYTGGALQYESDFGVDWRRVFAKAVALPPLYAVIFDPTEVEPQIFQTSIEGWDDLKRKYKRELRENNKEREFYKAMSRVVHLDLYALGECHCSVFRLCQQRTHGTTEEYVKFVLDVYKRPTFVFYDDDMEDFSDWMLQRGLEAKREYFVPFKIFPTIKKVVKFIRDHEEDIKQWDENYKEVMDAIRTHRAFARKYWRRKKGLTAPVITKITQELTEIYQIGTEVKEHLRECESILAVKKAKVVKKRINKLQQDLEACIPSKPKKNRKNSPKRNTDKASAE